MGFLVQNSQCSTCIYLPDSPLDWRKLEAEVADRFGGFIGHRICHHSHSGEAVACRGFWNRNKDKFPMGQIAQRLNAVEFVSVDTLAGKVKDKS